jgi:D-inositol-3-phosphate glycosyltransferase
MSLVVPGIPCWQDDLSLVIIGGASGAGIDKVKDELARLESLRAELGIQDLVTFQGAQDQDTLVYYYSAADVVVMPSHYESFGMVALEAMACGTPVVASKVGGLAYSVKDGQTGFLVPERDAQALAAKIRLLLCDEGLRVSLGRQAAQRAHNYGWPVIADRLLDLYQQMQPVHRPEAAAGSG